VRVSKGRGFAVVADEVRTLAQLTRESTDEIQTMISKLKLASAEVVTVIQESKVSVENSSGKVTSTLNALHNIKGEVERINSMSAQIASSATQQANTAASLAESIVESHQLSNQAVDVTQKISTSSVKLNQISSALHTKVMQYKTH